ncbi:MAG TPA: hypothetical protein VE988_01365 [Gemmataceae bacterium]|nr:hypothetical protein [Gemmataceae bacterium]
MSRSKKVLMVLSLTIVLGVWGCAQSSSPSSGSARLRELEAKSARLDDECKTATAARDQARKKVTLLEEQRAQLQDQVEHLERTVKDRDELKQTLLQRTAERDAMQAYLTQFSRDLQNLATKVDQAANQVPASPPVTATPMPILTSPRDD